MIPEQFYINDYKIIYIKSLNKISSIHAYVDIGSVNENEKESGICHLIEHVLLESWKNCKTDCTEYWSRRGVEINGKTTELYTEYKIFGSSKKSEDMFDYIASIISNPEIIQKNIDICKSAIKDEMLIHINNPEWKIIDKFYKSIEDNSGHNGYSRLADIDIKIKNLDIIGIKDIVKYYKKWYIPSNIFITVVSDISILKIKEMFKKYLIPNNSEAIKKIPLYIKCKNCVSILTRNDAEKSTFHIGFIQNNPNNKHFIYYQLINDMLCGDVSSILYKILRNKHKLIYGISLQFTISKSYVLSTFAVNCQFKNATKLFSEFMTSIKEFTMGNFTKDDLNRSKERLYNNYLNTCQENTEYITSFYSNQYILTGKIQESPSQVISKIKNISKKELLDIIEELFNFTNMIVVCEKK